MEDRPDQATDRQEIERLENEWMQAVADRNRDALDQLVGQGFRFTALHLHPTPVPRTEWMQAALTDYSILSFHYMNMDVDVFDDSAVVHARYSQVAHYNNVDLSNVFCLTDVWVRRDGRWQVVARHSSMER